MARREFDNIKVKDQLGNPDQIGIFGPFRKEETLIIEEGPTVIQHIDPNNHFTLDHSVRCDLDSATYELDTGLGTQTPYYEVTNPNNVFYWNFRYALGTLQSDGQYDTLGFIETGSTTATVDTTTNYRVDFTSGQILQSTSVFKDASSAQVVVAATLQATVGAGSFTYELSADGGSNWETVTLGTEHTFTNTGSDLRIKITENAASTGNISKLICSYTV